MTKYCILLWAPFLVFPITFLSVLKSAFFIFQFLCDFAQPWRCWGNSKESGVPPNFDVQVIHSLFPITSPFFCRRTRSLDISRWPRTSKLPDQCLVFDTIECSELSCSSIRVNKSWLYIIVFSKSSFDLDMPNFE